jgi:hypothetical protein
MNTQAFTLDAGSLAEMSQAELDDLYRTIPVGAIPTGDARGTAIMFPGTLVGRIIMHLISWFVWRGKVFDPQRGELRNKISPLNILAIRAKVYKDKSWLDGQPTIVLDYSQTSFVAQKIRDEIREVAPGFYLGKVWWGKRRLLDFALRF